MVKIRLKRIGATKRPVYRLVVADSRSPRDGRFIEAIGFYDPLPNPAVVRIDVDRVKLWIQRGARPSDTARDLLVREGVLTAPPRPAREPVSSGAGSVVADGSAGSLPDTGPVAAGTPRRRSSEIAPALPPEAPPASATSDAAPQTETAPANKPADDAEAAAEEPRE